MTLAAYRDLYRYLKQLTRYIVLQLFGNASGSCIGVVGMHDEGQSIHNIAGKQHVELDKL